MKLNEVIELFNKELDEFKLAILDQLENTENPQPAKPSNILFEIGETVLDGTNSIDTGVQLFNEDKEFTLVLKATIPNEVDLTEGNGKHRFIDFGVSRVWLRSNGSLAMTTQKTVVVLSGFGNNNKGKTYNIIVTNKLDETTNTFVTTYKFYNGSKKWIGQYHIGKTTENNTYIGGAKTSELFIGTFEAKIYDYAFSDEEVNNIIDFTGTKVNSLDY